MKSSGYRYRLGASVLGTLVFVAVALGCAGGQQEPDTAVDQTQNTAPANTDKLARAEHFIKLQQYDNAKSILNEVLAEDPNNAKALFYLGVTSEGLGDTESAGEHYKKALDLDATLIDAAINLSAILFEANDAAGALSAVEKGLAQDPKHPDLLMNRALALELLGRNDDAIAAYEKAVTARPEDLKLRYAYGELLAKAGKQDKALEQFNQVLEAKDVTLLAAASTQFGKLRKFDRCVAALDKAIKLQSEATLYVRRGVCRKEQNDFAGAKADYGEALKIDQKSFVAHYYLGMQLRSEGQKEKAIEHLTKAVELGSGTDFGKKAKQELDELKKQPAKKK